MPGRMAKQEAQAKRVDTQHDAANGVIEVLRNAAVTIKNVGDENLELENKLDEAEARVDDLERDAGNVEHWKDIARTMDDLLEDFRLELIDRDELLRKGRECLAGPE